MCSLRQVGEDSFRKGFHICYFILSVLVIKAVRPDTEPDFWALFTAKIPCKGIDWAHNFSFSISWSHAIQTQFNFRQVWVLGIAPRVWCRPISLVHL